MQVGGLPHKPNRLNAMTEAELTEQLLAANEQIYLAISVWFTVISAYILGLYWFLHKSGLLLRLEAFFMFTLVLGFLAVTSFALARHSIGITLALHELAKTTELSALGKMATENTAAGVYFLLTRGAIALFGFIYLGLFYLTFFYRWKDPQQ